MSVIKPSIPKGTRDFSPEILSKRNYLKEKLIRTFKTFGFQSIETPSFERSETLLGKYGDEGDRLIFKILNSGEKIKKADIRALEDENLQKGHITTHALYKLRHEKKQLPCFVVHRWKHNVLQVRFLQSNG